MKKIEIQIINWKTATNMTNAVDTHLWILYLWTHLLTKIYLSHQSQYLWYFCGHLLIYTEWQRFKCLICMFSAEVFQLKGNSLSSYFSSHIVNKCTFHSLFSATFFTFLCFFLVIFLFKMSPKWCWSAM